VYVYHPFKCYCSCVWVMVLLTMASLGLGMMTLEEQEDAWLIFDAEATQTYKAVEDARGRVDDVVQMEGSGRRLSPFHVHKSHAMMSRSGFLQEKPEQRRLQPQDDDYGETYIFYKIDGGNVFATAPLRQMCELDMEAARRLQADGDMSFEQMDTPLRFFYGSTLLLDGTPAENYFLRDNGFIQQLLETGCYDLSQDDIDVVVAVIAQSILAEGTSSVYARYVTRSFADSAVDLATVANPITTTKVAGHTDMLDKVVEDLTDKLGLSYGFLTSAFQADDDRFTNFGGVRVRLYYGNLDESHMIGLDLGMSLFSFVIVFSVLWIYTKSLFLASSGMLQIVLSLPVSGLFYRGVFQVKYFHFLHVLVVYLVLGIGADDIFVLVDTFIHLEREQAAKYPAWSQGRFKAAFKNAYVRTAGSIFNTSFTTAMAFMSSSGSKAMPMRTCGWFAAICILMNYVFTMTFFPAALAIWHYRLQGKKCCCCCPSLEARQDDEESNPSGPKAMPAEVQLGALESALQNGYVPFMSKKVGWVRPGALGMLIVGAAVAIQGTYFTAQLTPPRKPEVWIPDNHMNRDIMSFFPTASYSPDFEQYEVVALVWGIQGLDTGDLDVYEPDDFEGGTVYDASFNPTTVEAQQAVLDACLAFRQKTCNLEGCENGGNGLLMMDTAGQEWACFMEDFHKWVAFAYPGQHSADIPSSWPTGSDFLQKLQEFRSDSSMESRSASGCCAESRVVQQNYKEDIGFIDGELRYLQVRIRSTLPEELSYADGIDVRDMMDDWIVEQRALQPEGMGSLKYHGNGLFAQYDLGQELLDGFFQSLAIASPVAFIVLLISTWNIIVSFYALISVASVVVCVLGFCKGAMDWDLGIGEAIAGVIVLGYSVDYVVHLAHIYCEAGSHGLDTRDERAKYAIQNMGTTIFAGAITTGGSGIVMFFCFFQFFFKMAILITFTILFAFLFSLGFLMSLLWIMGPEGKCGDVVHLFCKCLRREKSTSPQKAGFDDIVFGTPKPR